MPVGKVARGVCGVLLCLTLAAACASFEKNTYRTIGATVTAVDLAMNVYGELHRAGRTSPEQDAKVKAVYEQYQAAVAGAQLAVDAYASTKDEAPVTRALAILAGAAAGVQEATR